MPIVDGTAIKQKFSIIQDSPNLKSLVDVEQIDAVNTCCFQLPALAQLIQDDTYKNDNFFEVFFWNNAYTTAIMKLQKFENNVWGDIADLTDDTLGTFFAYGFYETLYTESPIGYLLSWSLVLNAHGKGNYRIRCQGTQIAGGTLVDKYSLDFCLNEYTDDRADETVRLSYWYNGNQGDVSDDKKRRDYANQDLFSQLRIPDSIFGNDTSPEHETSFTKYQSGEMVNITNDQSEEYTLRTGLMSTELHRYLKVNILQSGPVSITDYNKTNPTPHTDKFVEWTGPYEPTYTDGVLQSYVEITFIQSFQNFTHKRC